VSGVERRARPHVVVHTAVSVDGATTGFDPDVGAYYRLAATFDEDVTLTGADTILVQEAALAEAPRPGPNPQGPLLVVVDTRARVREWTALREVGYWSGALAVSSARTPSRPHGVDDVVVGEDRADLVALLDRLGRRPGVEVVRVDSGGELTGALLQAGLVDEISLLVHPVLAGGARWWGAHPPPATALEAVTCEALDGGLVWLRSRVRR
jgi:2,5-diamino-6-(ribosylamino)-4(3H)-pyrimidinone 5'-phosphate reductase